ncbi:hypothetical protein PFLUV_G00048730 [Perca fluviatilis]|uniref:Uncharacterized protein n=1 Tax=Perca fluviatilis TaxID=8168 RepID=A0A6A5FMJ7_PERFL|nr:hypothetical protein PFLUV_G00048730 [Perca fluviatilis]
MLSCTHRSMPGHQYKSCSLCLVRTTPWRVTVAPGYCYTERDRETGFSSVLLFTEAAQTLDCSWGVRSVLS